MIIISPYAQKLRNGKINPKNYPYWSELVEELFKNGYDIVQVGVEGEEPLVPDFRKNLPLTELAELVNQCDTWISVDSFFQHFCWDLKKPGIVIWSQSNPLIFGHPENTNLLKDKKYLRKEQFWLWEQCEYNKDAFVEPNTVLKHIKQFISR
jgi:ADP-heptose:LPS heptosyltransferase